MGYTMVTAQGLRFTEWTAMAYNNATNAFEPQWAGDAGAAEAARAFAGGHAALPTGAILATAAPQPHPQCPAHGAYELYNHSNDPAETRNLAQQPWPAETANLIATLRAQLHAGQGGALPDQGRVLHRPRHIRPLLGAARV